jgi:hypothetical protein
MTSYSYSGALQSQSADSRVMLQLSLRTLGGTSLSQSVGSSSTSASNTGSGLPF